MCFCNIHFVAKYQKQAGIGPSRRHIQGSKIPKGLPRVNLQYSKIEKAKKWTEWRAKIVRPFGEKQIFEKKSHNAEKLKDDPLGFFNIHSVAKHQKIKEEKIFIFGKKSHGAKNLKGEPFGIFQHPF